MSVLVHSSKEHMEAVAWGGESGQGPTLRLMLCHHHSDLDTEVGVVSHRQELLWLLWKAGNE